MFKNVDELEQILFHWVMPVAEIAVFATWVVVGALRRIIRIIRGE